MRKRSICSSDRRTVVNVLRAKRTRSYLRSDARIHLIGLIEDTAERTVITGITHGERRMQAHRT